MTLKLFYMHGIWLVFVKYSDVIINHRISVHLFNFSRWNQMKPKIRNVQWDFIA